MQQARLPQVQTKTILLSGGLDLETPLMALGEGFALEAENFEPNLMGGYRKMQGYERLDGRTKPSDSVYYTLAVADSGTFNAGDAITGSVSGATAQVVIKDDALNLLGITDLTGSFTTDDTVSGVSVLSTEIAGGYPDSRMNEVWEKAAQDYYRAMIGPVPGTGKVLGAWHWNGKQYAFRSNGTNVIMYESSAAGWVEIDFFRLLKFDAGTFEDGDIEPGDTITGATSAATAEIKAVIYTDGAYGTDVEGYFIVDVTSGAFEDNENIQKTAVTIAVANGADTAITLTASDNRYEFVNYNFSGNSESYYMYGCDGVNNAFRWDGEMYIPIFTGNTVDAPQHIDAHTNHLFLSFPGGSLQNSTPTQPFEWRPLTGAGEIAVGEDIQQMRSVTGDALLVTTDRGIYGLYGQDIENWQLQKISVDGGDIGSTLDVIGTPLMLTRRGIQRVDASDRFGNFESSTVSRRVNPLIENILERLTVIGSLVVRAKNQYRLFFSDGTGLTLTADQLFGGQSLPEFTTFTLDFVPSCVESIAITGTQEIILVGGEDGYVYEFEKGTSLDGENMVYALRLPFHHLGSPQVRKAFKWLDIESDVPQTADLRVSYEFSDGASHTQTSPLRFYEFTGNSRAYWGEAFWAQFNWSDEIVSRESLSLSGTGHNISVLFYGNSATTAPFTINAITYQFLPRRLRRG